MKKACLEEAIENKLSTAYDSGKVNMVIATKVRTPARSWAQIPDFEGVFPPALFLVRPSKSGLEKLVISEEFHLKEVKDGFDEAFKGNAQVRYLSTNSGHAARPAEADFILHVGSNAPLVENPERNFVMREKLSRPLYFAKQGHQVSLKEAVRKLASIVSNLSSSCVFVMVGQEVGDNALVYIKDSLESPGKICQSTNKMSEFSINL